MMRKYLAIIMLAVWTTCAAQVTPGVEMLVKQGFEPLKGKRVGLITNPTGVDRNLKSTIDILHEAPEVELTALFAPEHGVRGDQYAGLKVSDGRDSATGVKIHSLYGASRKPTAAMRCMCPLYDPNRQLWIELAPLSMPRINHGVLSAGMLRLALAEP